MEYGYYIYAHVRSIQESHIMNAKQNNRLVSVIVPTKNSAQFLEACLQSVKDQSYKHIEIIVVDNYSTDTTKEIAKKFTDKVYNKGPERSAQRNYGASNGQGEFVVFIDADMELSRDVVKQCVAKISEHNGTIGIIIAEESFGIGFWAQCKKLEKSFYVGVDWIEAARFFPKEVFQRVGGYDEEMVAGEDWDLSQRIGLLGSLERIGAYIYHNEGRVTLVGTMKKKYYYARKIRTYMNKQGKLQVKRQTGAFLRYWIFLKHPLRLFRSPMVGTGMLYMKTCEFIGGLWGFMSMEL